MAAYRGARGGQDFQFMERQNDDQVEILSDKVRLLKNVAVDMGDEVRKQNRYIDGMDSDFSANFGLLGGVMTKLGKVTKAGGHKMLCYLIGFSLFVFFIIYFLAKSS